MIVDLDYIPFPGDENCPGCWFYNYADQCCDAENEQECAQLNGLLDLLDGYVSV